MVEEYVKSCLACRLNSKPSVEPLKPSEFPTKVWQVVAHDIYGPLPDGTELLVLKDEFSRMPFVAEVKTTAARYVLPILDDLFSFVGRPEILKSDNGPPFNGHEYVEFCEQMGIVPRFITPEHPKQMVWMKDLCKILVK